MFIDGRSDAGRPDVDPAIVAYEVEHAVDGGAIGVRAQLDFEVEITGFRVDLRKGRQPVAECADFHQFAEGRQVAQEGQRVHPVAQDVGAEAQREMPEAVAWFGGRGGLGLRHGFASVDEDREFGGQRGVVLRRRPAGAGASLVAGTISAAMWSPQRSSRALSFELSGTSPLRRRSSSVST